MNKKFLMALLAVLFFFAVSAKAQAPVGTEAAVKKLGPIIVKKVAWPTTKVVAKAAWGTTKFAARNSFRGIKFLAKKPSQPPSKSLKKTTSLAVSRLYLFRLE